MSILYTEASHCYKKNYDFLPYSCCAVAQVSDHCGLQGHVLQKLSIVTETTQLQAKLLEAGGEVCWRTGGWWVRQWWVVVVVVVVVVVGSQD